MENVSLEPPAGVAVRVLDCEIGFTLAGQFEACTFERRHHVRPGGDLTGDDQVFQPVLDVLSALGPKLLFRKLFGVLRPGRILRIRPAMFLVEHVA
jgi:hypothetical protein